MPRLLEIEKLTEKQNKKMHTRIECSPETEKERLVVVRYFLDRQGYSLQNSSARLWKNAPSICKADDIRIFIEMQGIKEVNDHHMLVEVLLDKYECYMVIDALGDSVVFDFSGSSATNPGVLNIRLTDLSSGEASEGKASESSSPVFCTTNPVGLFAFSLTVMMETADLYGKLLNNSVDPSFILTWGPYAFFVSGLLQLIAGMFEVTRNNIYGATAFLAFGSFWLANGTKLILIAYFPDQISPEYLDASDPVGNFVRNIYIMAFACVLFKQTLVSSKLSTILIGLLIILMFATALNGWSTAFQWIQMIVGTMVSVFAFYVFGAEFTNEVYQRDVVNLHPWSEDSPDQIFAAAGRTNTLQSRAAQLRLAGTKISMEQTRNVHDLRSVQPSERESKKSK